MVKLKIKVEYLIDEKEIESFIKSTKKYINNLTFKKNTTLNNDFKSKSAEINDTIILNNLKSFLIEPKTTMQIYKSLNKLFVHNSYKSVSRYLTELAIKGLIKVKKENTKKGGYKNYWYLSEVKNKN